MSQHMTSMTASTGKQGCPCTDASSILSSLAKRHCTTPDGQLGILLSPSSESCVPYSYGSSNCLQHDLVHNPECDLTQVNGTNLCIPWCYVDMETCVRDSEERVFRSSYFGDVVDVFYSYSTCNSEQEDWFVYAGSDGGSKQVLGGISIKAAIPTYLLPMMYKMSGGEILASPGVEYYNNSVPYAGVYKNYINSIQRIADGDIQNIVYTHRSRSSDILHPNSSYTATVQDIEDGLVDIAIGPFWITPQRLKMTAFTVPFTYDKTVLVIPKPGEKNSILHQTSKVVEPFTPGLWGLVIAIIIFTALLSVWFSEKPKMKPSRRESLEQMKPQQRRQQSVAQKQHFRRRRDVYARKFLDAVLEKGMFFFSAGVGQDEGASLPHKLLMFGFSFFILISVSAYVANLAAFLTRAVPNYVGTMEGAVEYGLKICGHPALQEDLEITWPNAKFVFSNTGKEIRGQLADYYAGKCDVMAVSREDATEDLELMNEFCEHGLVFTDSLVIEIPMAFPIKPELAAGFSYWMYQGEKYHVVSIEQQKVSYNELNNRFTNCNVELSEQDKEENDYTQISPLNMSFPIMFWCTFSILAIILQIIHVWKAKKGKGSLILGTTSSFDIFAKSYRSAKNTNRGVNDDIISSDPAVRPSKMEDTSRDDWENQLPGSIIEPIPILHKPDESENDCVDDFDENGHACTSANSEVPILKSSTAPLKHMKVSFSLENEGSFTHSDHAALGVDCSNNNDDIKCRIERLVENSAVAEFLECFQEMKKLKDK